MKSKARIAPLVLLMTLLTGPASLLAENVIPAGWTRADAAHLMRRAGFGATPVQIDALFALGKAGAVEYMLSGQAPPGVAPPFASAELPKFVHHDPEEPPAPTTRPGTDEERTRQLQLKILRKIRKGALQVQHLRDWWLDRMVRSDHPLEEKMTLFWHGLLTSGVKEVKDGEMLVRQNLLFHEMALGSYLKLTHGIINDGAMLRYLNAGENIKGKPNENLARELMELFTMGEGNGYTEQDIGQAARALTGLGAGNFGSVMRPRLHDDDVKTIFGKTGNFGPDELVELILSKPEPAQYLAKKLWEFYAYPEPSMADLAPVIDALRSTRYELKPALRAIFMSPQFYSEKAKFSLITSPTEIVVQTIRELGPQSEPPAFGSVLRDMSVMGQELLQPPNVKGWPGGEHWITSSSLFTRYNTACNLVNGTYGEGGGRFAQPSTRPAARPVSPRELFPKLPVDCSKEQLVDAAIDHFLQRPINTQKRDVLIKSLGDSPLTLGQKGTDQRVREMLCLLLSTPEYQVH